MTIKRIELLGPRDDVWAILSVSGDRQTLDLVQGEADLLFDDMHCLRARDAEGRFLSPDLRNTEFVLCDQDWKKQLTLKVDEDNVVAADSSKRVGLRVTSFNLNASAGNQLLTHGTWVLILHKLK